MSIVPANLATSPDGHTDGPDQSGDHPVDTGTDAPTAPTLETQSAMPGGQQGKPHCLLGARMTGVSQDWRERLFVGC